MIKLIIESRDLETINRRTINDLNLVNDEIVNDYITRDLWKFGIKSYSVNFIGVVMSDKTIRIRMGADQYNPDIVKKEFINFYKSLFTSNYFKNLRDEISNDELKLLSLGYNQSAAELKTSWVVVNDIIFNERYQDYLN